MRKGRSITLICFVLLISLLTVQSSVAFQQSPQSIDVLLGDSWESLSWRFNIPKEALLNQNSQVNPYLSPAIGTTISIPSIALERSGTAVTLQGESLILTALKQQVPINTLIKANNISQSHLPFYGTLFIPQDNEVPRVLPQGFDKLELSHIPAKPGIGIGWRGVLSTNKQIKSHLNGRLMKVSQNGNNVLGLTGTGAFFGTGAPLLEILGHDGAYWAQPWHFKDPDLWTYQQITLTGTAAQIDQEAIQAERERLFELWEVASPNLQLNTPMQTPVDSFLTISSSFGARRSYNGGPYRTYHEGVDYAAYGGTAVLAPTAGTVIVSEFLYVRGGTIIIDHGLGIYTGYYHLSSIGVEVGTAVQRGDFIGEVGTTGLSTGNHLHWDLLVDAIWVDALSWQEDGMNDWILAGWDGDY